MNAIKRQQEAIERMGREKWDEEGGIVHSHGAGTETSKPCEDDSSSMGRVRRDRGIF